MSSSSPPRSASPNLTPRSSTTPSSRSACSPQQAWHVGDSLRADVAGARAAGLTSVWLNRLGAPRPATGAPDIEVASLFDLLPAMLGTTTL